MNTKDYYKTRKPFRPEFRVIYENEGGGHFECLSKAPERIAIMRNIKSGWTFTAVGIGIYEDGKIDWDYSTGGTF